MLPASHQTTTITSAWLCDFFSLHMPYCAHTESFLFLCRLEVICSAAWGAPAKRSPKLNLPWYKLTLSKAFNYIYVCLYTCVKLRYKKSRFSDEFTPAWRAWQSASQVKYPFLITGVNCSSLSSPGASDWVVPFPLLILSPQISRLCLGHTTNCQAHSEDCREMGTELTLPAPAGRDVPACCPQTSWGAHNGRSDPNRMPNCAQLWCWCIAEQAGGQTPPRAETFLVSGWPSAQGDLKWEFPQLNVWTAVASLAPAWDVKDWAVGTGRTLQGKDSSDLRSQLALYHLCFTVHSWSEIQPTWEAEQKLY